MALSRRTMPSGIGLALIAALISGVAVYANGYGVSSWKSAGTSAATYTTAKNLMAASILLLLVWLANRRRSSEGFTRPSRPGQWLGLATVGIIGGSLPFLLFFEGLTRASSGQAAFIHKTLVIWVALLAVPLLRERLGLIQLGAIGLLVAGQYFLVGGISHVALDTGEMMILAATLLWAVEVIIAKRLLTDLSPLTVGTTRMCLGVAILIGYAIATGAPGELAALGLHHWWWVVATGAILTLYVATWFSALARASAVDVTAVLVGGAVITALLRSGLQSAPLPSAVGLGLIVLGAIIAVTLTWWAPRRTLARVPEAELETASPYVIVGLGNEIASDDGVGIHVARALETRFQDRPEVEVVALPWAGFALLDVLRGRQGAALVDCLTTGIYAPGSVVRLDTTDFPGSVRLNSFHDISYPIAIDLGRNLGWEMPDDVAIWGVEAAVPEEFGETLSPEVAESVTEVVQEVASFIDARVASSAELVGASR